MAWITFLTGIMDGSLLLDFDLQSVPTVSLYTRIEGSFEVRSLFTSNDRAEKRNWLHHSPAA